jgi:hypothetical protein
MRSLIPHLTLKRAVLLPDGSVRFHVYLDGGTPEAPVHVVAADLLDSDKHLDRRTARTGYFGYVPVAINPWQRFGRQPAAQSI